MISRCFFAGEEAVPADTHGETLFSQGVISVKNEPIALMSMPPEMIMEILSYLSPDDLYQVKNINNSALNTLCNYTLTHRTSKTTKQDELVYCAIDNNIGKLRFIIGQSLAAEIKASRAAYSLTLMLAINNESKSIVLELLSNKFIPEGTFYDHIYCDAQAFVASLPSV